MVSTDKIIENWFEVEIKPLNEIFRIIFNLSLIYNLSGLSLPARSNNIYLGHIKAVIIDIKFFHQYFIDVILENCRYIR